MAENTTSYSIVTASPEHTCTMSGCIAHGPGQSVNQSTGAVTRYTVHFRTSEKIMKHAIESFNRGIALNKRNAKAYPTDRVIDLYEDYSYSKTTEEVLEEESKKVNTMTPEQKEKYVQELMLRLQAAQSVTHVQAPSSEQKKR